MKNVKIGTKEYRVMETLFDMGDQRFNVFKQHILQAFEDIDKPLFLATYQKVITYFNQGQNADAIIELHNFKKALDLKPFNYDAYSFCFCLMVLNEGEDMNDTTDATQLPKMEDMRKNGLTRGMIEEEVTNFMKASPNTFGVYLQVLEMTKLQLSDEILKT